MFKFTSMIVLLALASTSSYAQWNIDIEDRACQLKKTVSFFSDNQKTNEQLKLQFTINPNQKILFNIDNAEFEQSAQIPMILFAEGAFTSSDSSATFKLEHSDSRELLLILREYTMQEIQPVDIAVVFEDNPGIVLKAEISPQDVIGEIQNNSYCFDQWVSAVQKL